jgi:hypothetical protein
MIGMPTPTWLPSLSFSETCTGLVTTGAEDELDAGTLADVLGVVLAEELV